MSLEAQLTTGALRAHAGYAFARGDAYFRGGKVEAAAMRGDELTGIVVGTQRYHVRVFLEAGQLASTCTCPMELRCKHMVALCLAYIDRSPTSRVTPPEGLLETREALIAWARERGVEHALQLSADLLLPRVAGTYVNPHTLYGLALRDTGAWGVVRRYLPHAANALAAATLARLEEEAVRVAEARAELPPPAPSDDALSPLWQFLRAERAVLITRASPRPQAWRREQKWAFDPRERCIRWKEREEITLPTLGRLPVLTQLGTQDGNGELVLSCACSAKPARCAHALALVDTTLELLGDPERVPEATMVAEELLRPSWSRALAKLALQTAAAEKPAPAIEVWWQLEHELRTPTLTAIVRKQTKRGGMTGGARIAPGRLLEQYGERLDARDRAIAEQLTSWDPEQRHSTSYPARAFAAAVGHARLVDEQDLPVMLVRAQLGFTAVPDGDGLRIEPAIDGEPMEREVATMALANLNTGEPLLV
ncbi:hypothetical protein BH11MYX3_BH11MYX3_16680 [soil metagenome]